MPWSIHYLHPCHTSAKLTRNSYTSCRVSRTYSECVDDVLRLCHCAVLFCTGKEEPGRWKDRWWQERKVLIPMWHMDPVYTYLSAARWISWPLLLHWPLDLHTPHTNWFCPFFIFICHKRTEWVLPMVLSEVHRKLDFK